MSSKGKGTRYERELFHMFYNTGLFATLRTAGSGSTPLPAPDLLVGNPSKVYAIECKALKKGTKYFKKGEIEELIEFSTKFGAKPIVAIRYNGKGWFFLETKDIEKTSNGFYSISEGLAQNKGKKFEEIIK